MRRTFAALVLAALAAAPAAAQPPAVVGLAATLDGNGLNPAVEAQRIAAAGVGWVREDLEWAEVQSSPLTANWATADVMFAAAARAGLRVLPILDAPPCWAVSAGTPPTDCHRRIPADVDAYARFAAAAAARYGPGGTFWAANPSLDPELAAPVFELLNEPYLTDPDPARYATLAVAAANAGRAGNPATMWLVAATTTARGRDGTRIDWPHAMLAAAPNLPDVVSGLAIHVYPGPHPPAAGERFVADVRAAYAAHGLDRPIWITETGFGACDEQARCVPGTTRAEREGRKAAALGELVTALRTATDVVAVFAYTLREGTDPFVGSFGLLDIDAQPLPALAAFAAAAGPGQSPLWGWPPPRPLP